MSVSQQVLQQLHQDLQNELTTANQLLYLISNELQQIKAFTEPGGKFASNIKENATIMETLGSLTLNNINIENIAPVRDAANVNPNNSQDQSILQDASNMDDSR